MRAYKQLMALKRRVVKILNATVLITSILQNAMCLLLSKVLILI